MAEEGFKHKLTAIFSADAEGYSRRIGDDEEAIAEAKKAVDLVPSNAWANATLGTFLAYADWTDEVILVSQNALRLNPFPTDSIHKPPRPAGVAYELS